MIHKFPKFTSHDLASCFNCGADLDGSWWCKSGSASGHGEFRQDCEKCRMFTCYDLSEDIATAIKQFFATTDR